MPLDPHELPVIRMVDGAVVADTKLVPVLVTIPDGGTHAVIGAVLSTVQI
jgi:hypothetical protein